MVEYLYYCRNCNTLEDAETDNAAIKCPECGQYYYPLHVTEDEWAVISNDEKRQVLQEALMPKRNNLSMRNSQNQMVQQQRSSYTNYYEDEDDYGYSSRTSRNNRQSSSKSNRQSSNRSLSGSNYPQSYSYEDSDKASKMSIIAFILSLTGCLSIVGLILGIIDFTKKDGHKKGFSVAAIIIGSILLIGSFIFGGNTISEKRELKASTEESSPSDIKLNNTADSNEFVSENNISNQAPVSDVTITEQVLVDQDGVKITAVEYVTDSIWGDGIKMLLENSTSQELMFSCDALIVNDFMITDLFAQSVTPGNSAYETLHLSNTQLREAGIDNVGKIEMYFRVYDNATWDDLFKTGCITLQTSDYNSMDTTTTITGIELYNKNDIKIFAQYVDENSFWGKAILLYVENNSSKNITVSADNLAVNGFMFSPMYSDTIYAGKKSINDITLFSSELEQNNVTSIDDVEIQFNIFETDTFTGIDKTDSIKFSTH